MIVISEAEKIKYNELPKVYAKIRRLQSDNDYLLEKIVELEERLAKFEEKPKAPETIYRTDTGEPNRKSLPPKPEPLKARLRFEKCTNKVCTCTERNEKNFFCPYKN